VIIPSTVYQLFSVLLLVVPGIVFAGVRRTLVGPSPEDRDFSVRVVRALATSAIFDAIYLIVGGPEVVHILHEKPKTPGALSGFAAYPRQSAAVALALLVAIPALAAALPFARFLRPVASFLRIPPNHLWIRKILAYPNQSTPSAWDYAATIRAYQLVSVFTDDGKWVGGWLGADAFLSTYPEPRDIFIDHEWEMAPDGRPVKPIDGSQGIYVPLGSNARVSWFDVPGDETTPPAHNRRDRKLLLAAGICLAWAGARASLRHRLRRAD
jgi:hypothetical protein